MSRPLRIEFPGATYHVMNRGLASRPIFSTDADRITFLEGLGEVHARWGLRIFAYCLMRTHYHLCVQTPQVPLSRVMRHIDGVYTQRYNRRQRRDGPLFRGRYRGIVVDADRYLLAVVRYIHQNPVTAGVVAHPERYHWSSLRAYLTVRGRPAWLDTQTVLAHFQGRRPPFLAFMLAQPEAELTAFYRAGRAAPILGTEPFTARLRVRQSRQRRDREVPERRHLAVPLEACLRAVARAYDVPEERLAHARRGVTNPPRQVAMYVCREVGGYSHRAIAERLRAGSYSTVSSVCAMLKARLKEDRDLRRQFDRIRGDLVGQYGQQAT
jgi:REP element-mobilizing transposase RayT